MLLLAILAILASCGGSFTLVYKAVTGFYRHDGTCSTREGAPNARFRQYLAGSVGLLFVAAMAAMVPAGVLNRIGLVSMVFILAGLTTGYFVRHYLMPECVKVGANQRQTAKDWKKSLL